jgi:hypothetical protein
MLTVRHPSCADTRSRGPSPFSANRPNDPKRTLTLFLERRSMIQPACARTTASVWVICFSAMCIGCDTVTVPPSDPTPPDVQLTIAGAGPNIVITPSGNDRSVTITGEPSIDLVATGSDSHGGIKNVSIVGDDVTDKLGYRHAGHATRPPGRPRGVRIRLEEGQVAGVDPGRADQCALRSRGRGARRDSSAAPIRRRFGVSV